MKLPFPWRGRSDYVSQTDQPPLTTPEMVNVQVGDERTGRKRGAQRPGLSRVSTDPAATGEEVRHLATVAYDKKRFTYTNLSAEQVELLWSYVAPTGLDCRAAAPDGYGSFWVVLGKNGVGLLGADGVVTRRFQVPLNDGGHELGEIAVDEFGAIYVGVTAGGKREQAGVWRFYTSSTDGKLKEAWSIQLDSYVVRMVARDGRLWILTDKPDRNKSELWLYTDLTAGAPTLVWSRETASKANDLAVNGRAEALVACGPDAQRNIDPKYPDFGPRAADWNPKEHLHKYDARAWTHLDARALTDLAEGDEVTFWEDQTGNGRHAHGPGVNAHDRPPTFSAEGFGGLPAVRFGGLVDYFESGGTITPRGQVMWSGINSSIAPSAAGSQQTLLPGYVGAKWAMFMALIPESDALNDWAIISQTNTALSPVAENVLRGNWDNGLAAPPTPAGQEPGALAWQDTDRAGTTGRALLIERDAPPSANDEFARTITQFKHPWTPLIGIPRFTIEAWIDPATASGAAPFTQVLAEWSAQAAGEAFKRGFVLFLRTKDFGGGMVTRLGIRIYNTPGAGGENFYFDDTGGGDIITGALTYVAVTYNNTTNVVRLYTNPANNTDYKQWTVSSGGLSAPTASTKLLLGSAVPDYEPGIGETDSYEGTIDDLAIHAVALTPDEILARYNAGAGTLVHPTADTACMYHFDDPSETTANGPYIDSSTYGNTLNGNNGTSLVASTLPVSGQSTAGAGGQPRSGFFANKNNAVIVSIVHDGGGVGGDAGLPSVVRINGAPVDTYHSKAFATLAERTLLGRIKSTAYNVTLPNPLKYGRFLLGELLVLRDYDAATEGGGNGIFADVVELPVEIPGDLSTAYPDGGHNVLSDTEIERIEGYMAWGWGIPSLLDDGAGDLAPEIFWGDDGPSSDGFVHPFTRDRVALSTQSPPNPAGKTQPSLAGALLALEGMTAKFNASGKPIWVAGTGANSFGGHGYGVAVHPTTNDVYSMGPDGPSVQAGTQVWKLKDLGDTTSILWSWNASPQFSTQWEYNRPRMAVDAKGQVYIPYNDPDSTATTPIGPASLWVLRSDITNQNAQGELLLQYALPHMNRARQILLPPTTPDYDGDIADIDSRAEVVYIVSEPSEYSTLNLRQNASLAMNVRIDDRTYSFTDDPLALANPDTVLIGGLTIETVENLRAAINADPAGEGVVYGTGTVRHATARATTVDGAAPPKVVVAALEPGVNALGSVNLAGEAAMEVDVSNPGTMYWGDNALDSDEHMERETDVVHKARLVSITPINTGSVRQVVSLAVVGSELVRWDPTPVVRPSPTFEIITGTPLISSAVLFGELYIATGRDYLVYNAKKNSLERLEAVNNPPPPRCKLVCAWNGRLVLARDPDDPHQYHMSAKGNGRDWNFLPLYPTAVQAVSGTNAQLSSGASPMTAIPDIINALLPYSDDLLYFFCDRSIWRMTGDPLAGGALDNVSTVVGGAFGHTATRDDRGVIYFISTAGDVYALSPNGVPVPMNVENIRDTLRKIDLTAYRPQLIWDQPGACLRLYYFSLGGGDTLGFTWERETDAWSEFNHASAITPTAVGVGDGDEPGDRVLLLGCVDGSIRKLDPEADNDDGETIFSSVLLGPYYQRDEETIWSGMRAVLPTDLGSVRYEVYGSDTPQRPENPEYSGTLLPGAGECAGWRLSAAYFWVRLMGDGIEHWALESLDIDTHNAGLRRPR